MDPESGDSLVMKGDATLSFAMDPSGKMTLTGNYEVSEGSYHVSMNALIHKNFAIAKGSTIKWNGNLLEAEIEISGIYTIKTAPIDLVADQIDGLTESEKNMYKQRLPFLVGLHIKGQLLKPDISFDIQLPPEYKGAMAGTVDAKLNSLNENPSELNKQVFALLVLNRFVQQDLLATDGAQGAMDVARESVSKFLSQQLNKFSQQYIKGVELDFNLQSYTDYSSGSAANRTQLALGIKKQLFHERLKVQIGSSVDLEGAHAKQNSTSELAGDVTIEYQLSKNGNYRLKAFRENQYGGIIDGTFSETGIGLIYIRDYNTWKELFSKPKKIVVEGLTKE